MYVTVLRAAGRRVGDWLWLHASNAASGRLHGEESVYMGRPSQGEEPGGIIKWRFFPVS